MATIKVELTPAEANAVNKAVVAYLNELESGDGDGVLTPQRIAADIRASHSTRTKLFAAGLKVT